MDISKVFLKKALHNEKGIALLMVMGVIAILTFLLADFTFETKLNKIKIYNQQDKIQARLNAEAGLNFALATLRLYQVGRNKIEKDENLKNYFPSAALEESLLHPFILPLPLPAKIDIIQKTAADEFIKKTIFHGELSVTFNKVAGFLNPNTLRMLPVNHAMGAIGPFGNESDPGAAQDGQDEKAASLPASAVVEKKLTETLQRLIKDKNDTDEDFHQKYANVDAQELVKELQYYVNAKGLFQDPSRPEIEAKFNQKNIIPKFAPMSSIDELYLLPSWDDAIVDLVKDRMSIHEVSIIAVNELTVEDLKILFPAINNIQIEEFFKYRDGDLDKKIAPKKFKDADDFKKVITGELNIINETEYQERISSLKSAGLVIDTAGKLYKVTSRGSMNNAIFNIVAFIDLPIKPQPKQPKKAPLLPGQSLPPEEQEELDAQAATREKEHLPEKSPPMELLSPRVVEVRLE